VVVHRNGIEEVLQGGCRNEQSSFAHLGGRQFSRSREMAGGLRMDIQQLRRLV